jgi:hypothetical protein
LRTRSREEEARLVRMRLAEHDDDGGVLRPREVEVGEESRAVGQGEVARDGEGCDRSEE